MLKIIEHLLVGLLSIFIVFDIYMYIRRKIIDKRTSYMVSVFKFICTDECETKNNQQNTSK